MTYPTYKTPEAYQKYLRHGGTTHDDVIVAGKHFTMSSYDMGGSEIVYDDPTGTTQLYIATSNRYSEKKFSDAMVEILSFA